MICNNNLIEIRGNDYKFLRQKELNPPKKTTGACRVVDLFCGCGGISIGLREACYALNMDFHPVLAVDFLDAACRCYAKNFPGADVRNADISELFSPNFGTPLTKTELQLRRSAGRVDLLVGGPPCQGHSDLNNYTRRNDPKNQLYLLMLRAAEVFHPRCVIIENVMGAAHDKHHVVQTVQSNLECLGYKVELGSVYMPEIGVPQTRRRLLIVATLKKWIGFDSLVSKYTLPARDLRWAIEDLVGIPHDVLVDKIAIPSKDNLRRMQFLFQHNLFDLPNSERPPCHRDGKYSYDSIYGRLSWDKPSQTVTTGFQCMSMGRYVHPQECRTLTGHEAARLQFFPDYYDFSPAGKRTSLSTVIGNAVPSKLPYLLGIELISSHMKIRK